MLVAPLTNKGVLTVRLWIGALLLFLCSAALSQPPSPGPSKTSQEQKADTSKAAKGTKAAQNRPRESPLSVTIDKPVTVQKSEQDRSAEARNSEHKASNEWWLVVWTAVLAGITFLLAVITGVLARYTYKLWYDTSETGKRQAIEMRDSLAISKQSANAAESTATITNFAFHLTHRPKLIIRWIYLINERSVQFEVTNIGEVGAELLGMHAEMCMDKLPAKSPYTDEAGATGVFPKFIHAGQAHAITWEVMGDKVVEEFQMELGWNEGMADGPHANGARKIYFLGYITYQDEKIHIRHRTSFCRLYDYRKRRFVPMADPDPDYEHAD